MKKSLIPMFLILAATLAGCSHDVPPAPPPVPAYQPAAPTVVQAAPAAAPVIVNAAPASSGAGDMLAGAALGGAAGYMLGASTARSNAPPAPAAAPATVINKTVIHKTVVVKQAPPPPPPRPVAPVRAPVSLVKSSPAAPSYRAPSTSYAPSRSYAPSTVSYSGMRK